MKEIPLSQGKFALVDDADFEWLKQWKWSAHKPIHGNYAAYRACRCPFDHKRQMVYMHRQIVSCPSNKEVDHINGDSLDNQRSNLRICTHQQNMLNQKTQVHSSVFKGVSWFKRDGRWRVYVGTKHLGYFDSEIEAAFSYDAAARECFGQFAHTNF